MADKRFGVVTVGYRSYMGELADVLKVEELLIAMIETERGYHDDIGGYWYESESKQKVSLDVVQRGERFLSAEERSELLTGVNDDD